MRRKRIDFHHLDIPTKANKILRIILFALLLIALRIWHLSVVQYDQKVEEAKQPKQKNIVVPALRASIRDRFNIPLAMNKVAYEAAVFYPDLRDIPSFVWQKDENGKKTKQFKRREYIHKLASMLAEELHLDEARVEDLIHAKAVYYAQAPYVIKQDITEKEYYRLKALEREWPGLRAEMTAKRTYPAGKVAADVVGYVGAINKTEYEKILYEMKAIEQFIHEREMEGGEEEWHEIEQAKKRVEELRAKAYTIRDVVGKAGVEAIFEEDLRGQFGQKSVKTDSKGNVLSELPSLRAPQVGERVILSLSVELQEYAEQLLAQNEQLRSVRKSTTGQAKKTTIAEKHPWIKGGAIVALDPNTGEVLALASYPRFNPDDFILTGEGEERKEKVGRINQWFENEAHIAELWHQQQPLRREKVDPALGWVEEEKYLSWPVYLDFVLSHDGKLNLAMRKIKTIGQAIDIERSAKAIQELFEGADLKALFAVVFPDESDSPGLKKGERERLSTLVQENKNALDRLKKPLEVYFRDLESSYDKVLLVDLCRIVVAEERFDDPLIQSFGGASLEGYINQTAGFVTLSQLAKEGAREVFHSTEFQEWRESKGGEFLKAKRQEEKEKKSYAKPYLDYFDQKEAEMFREFFAHNKYDYIYTALTGNHSSSPALETFAKKYASIKEGRLSHPHLLSNVEALATAVKGRPKEETIAYLKTMRTFDELTGSLYGKYRLCGNQQTERKLSAAFYPRFGFGYARSNAYRQSSIQGSLFKLITAYEALVQQFKKMGKRVLSQSDLNPLVMVDDVYQVGGVQYVGYTEEGKPIPQLYKGGRLPRSLAHPHSGRLDLIRALEVSSNPYFSLLAGECLESPNDLAKAAKLFGFGAPTEIDLPGEISGNVPSDLATNKTGLYATAIGQHTLVVTPLQTAVMLAAIANGGKVLKPKLVKMKVSSKKESGKARVSTIPTEVRREIFMPDAVRHMLLRGLRAVSLRTHQESMTSLARLYQTCPEAIRTYKELRDQILGKTSTSESVETIDLDLHDGTNIYTHVWFGCIALEDPSLKKHELAPLLKDEFGKPELVVVVYLRFGGYGKEAAPLAAQIVKKWREIKERHGGF